MLRLFLLLLALLASIQGLRPGPRASWKKRLTGADLDTSSRWQVAGTDLGIPYVLENLSIGYLFGDTFSSPWPEDGLGWRSPVLLRSNSTPGSVPGIIWDSAASVPGDGFTPEIMHNGHFGPDHEGSRHEVTVIPNDAVSFVETRRQIVSYMSIEAWYDGSSGAAWKTNYAGIAYSDDGNNFIRTSLKWENNPDNSDPFQMWTMQRDGEYVYIFSVRSGRQRGPMMLRRVLWQRVFYPEEYDCWGAIGTVWGWGNPCTPILEGVFGEPSVRKLGDRWVMTYLNLELGAIVSRTAVAPDRPWTEEKVQVTWEQEPNLYGGFIHPWSSTGEDELHLLVSTWRRDPNNPEISSAYHVSQYVGSV